MSGQVDSRASRASTSDGLHRLSAWIDAGNEHREAEARTWGRLAKVSEECGEVIAAYIGMTGQNPRKGFTHGALDVEEELLDVAVTALCAVAHLRGNDPTHDLDALLAEKVERVVTRVLPPLASREERAPRCPSCRAPEALLPSGFCAGCASWPGRANGDSGSSS